MGSEMCIRDSAPIIPIIAIPTKIFGFTKLPKDVFLKNPYTSKNIRNYAVFPSSSEGKTKSKSVSDETV